MSSVDEIIDESIDEPADEAIDESAHEAIDESVDESFDDLIEKSLSKIYWNFVTHFFVFDVTFTFIIPFFWFNHMPYKFIDMPYKASVDSAILAALEPIFSSPNSTTNAIRYDLSVDLRFRNRGFNNIWYQEISAAAFYNGSTMLGIPDEMTYGQDGQGRPKNTATWQTKLRGTVVVRSSAAAELEMERADGTVHIQVRVSLSLARKVRTLVPVIYGSYDCWLWFPPPGDGAPAIFAEGTKCFPVK